MLTGRMRSALAKDAVKDSLVGSEVRKFWGIKGTVHEQML